MDKDFSKKIIRNTFENKFDKSRFANFIVELLNLDSQVINEAYVSYNMDYIPGIYRPYIDSFEKIASYEPDGAKLDILVVRLNKESSVERARTMQRNFIAWYLKGNCDGQQRDAALAAFVSPDEYDWRFSLIKMDYSIDENEKGKVKISEHFSSAKRWSFLVGSNERSHTAQIQLLKIVEGDDKNITLDQLEEAFSIERVTKEFFEKYRELFYRTNEALEEILKIDDRIRAEFEEKDIKTSDFAKKLLGQIVFLYFLQKKGWFGVDRDDDWGTGPKDFLRRLFDKKYTKYDNFFNDILEPLFYSALRIDRSSNDDYYDKFNCKIPFLNGGLFDPINDYDWVHTDIEIDNGIFSNSEVNNNGDKGTGILDIFDRYNFTVKEDEPLEKEVAVDPEMLGKVFENLLEIKDRKSKGTYYTPREIVHYMCQQSLINYLTIGIEEDLSKDDIEILIKDGEHLDGNNADSINTLQDLPASIKRNSELLEKKLCEIKVCDPAVGSGAFLVGMMSEIVKTRNVLSRYLGKSKKIVYEYKRECIENSLYGVDIDKGAVEICKLRLWLSLIVDEEDIKQIKPLPNLDYKIISANSLMSIPKNLFNQELFTELENLKIDFFDEINPNKKKYLKDKINKITDQISNNHNSFDFEVHFSEIFHNYHGFDILIANPPYLEARHSNFSELQKDIAQKGVKSRWNNDSVYIKRGSDLLIYFFELGLYILNKTGTLVFLTQNAWLNTDYGKNFQLFLLRNANVQYIIDSDYKYFDNKEGPNINTIITVANRIMEKSNKINFIRFHESFGKIPTQIFNLPNQKKEKILEHKEIDYHDNILKEIKWGILLDGNEEFLNLLKVLKKKSDILNKIGDYSISVGQGLNINRDLIHDSSLYSTVKFVKEISIPFMTTEDGSPFELLETKYFLIDGLALSDSEKKELKEYNINSYIPGKKRLKPFLILPRGISRHFCAMNIAEAYTGSCVEVYDCNNNLPEEIKLNIWLFLNSSIAWLWREISGRKNLGGGLLKAEATDLRTLPIFFNFENYKEIKKIYDCVKKRHAENTVTEIETEEHKKIDDLVFEYLDLDKKSKKVIMVLLEYLLESRHKKSKT